MSAPDVKRYLRRHQFFETPYGRGRWVSVWVDGDVNWEEVGDLLEAAYRLVANKRMLAELARGEAKPR